MNIAVFASHGGSDMQAIIDGCKNNKIDANVAVVISNNGDSMALQRANKENIPSYQMEENIYRRKQNKELRVMFVGRIAIKKNVLQAIKIVNQDLSKMEQEEERMRYEQSIRERESSGNDYEV